MQNPPPNKFYEVLLVDGVGYPCNLFLVHANSHADAVVEALNHIPEGVYIRKIWEQGHAEEEWRKFLGSMGITLE